jgi:hypothetical protein
LEPHQHAPDREVPTHVDRIAVANPGVMPAITQERRAGPDQILRMLASDKNLSDGVAEIN